MTAAKGGRRPGAGRPSKPVKYAGAITAAERKIKDKLPEIVDAQIALALGVKTKTDEGDIYTTLPDKAAGQYLINRIMGSPTQKQDIDVHGKGTQITVRHINHATSD